MVIAPLSFDLDLAPLVFVGLDLAPLMLVELEDLGLVLHMIYKYFFLVSPHVNNQASKVCKSVKIELTVLHSALSSRSVAIIRMPISFLEFPCMAYTYMLNRLGFLVVIIQL